MELSAHSLPPALLPWPPDLWSKVGEHLQGKCPGKGLRPSPVSCLAFWMPFFALQNVTCFLAFRKPLSQPSVSYGHLGILSTEL